MLSRFVTVAVFGVLTIGAASPADPRLPMAVEGAIHDVSAAELRRTIAALESDEFQGRGLGHQGNRRAELFIADALRDAKVPPAAPGYFQPIEVYDPTRGSAGHLTVSSAGKTVADLATGSDFFPLPMSGDAVATGPVVFAGHGISAPEFKHDDYAGVNAAGAIVIVLEDAPDALRRHPGLSSDDRIDIASV